MDLDLLSQAEGAALIAAGLLSVVLFPITGLALLKRSMAPAAAGPEPQAGEETPIMAM